MKILHIAGQDLDGYRRAQLALMAALYHELGVAQLILMPQGAPPLSGTGLPVRTYAVKGLFDLKGLKTLEKDVEAFAPHIIQSHSPAACALVAGSLKSHEDVHAAFEGFPPGAALYLSPRAAPPLTDPALLEPKPRAASGGFTVGTILPCGAGEELDMLLQALREVPGARLSISLPDGEKAETERRAARLRMQDRVTLTPWPIDGAAFMAGMDAYAALPGFWPDMAVPGAWAADIPVIDGPGSVLEWRRALAQLAAEPDARRALAAEGRLALQSVAAGQDAAAPYFSAYRALLDRQRA